MSSTKARDVPKGTGGNTNKSGGKSANNKGDHKSDKVDLNPKILVLSFYSILRYWFILNARF
jgi:hypothetical protein